jgi:hypothetical protein
MAMKTVNTPTDVPNRRASVTQVQERKGSRDQGPPWLREAARAG